MKTWQISKRLPAQSFVHYRPDACRVHLKVDLNFRLNKTFAKEDGGIMRKERSVLHLSSFKAFINCSCQVIAVV